MPQTFGSKMTPAEELRLALLEHKPESEFRPVTESDPEELRTKYPGFPELLAELYSTIGYGSIGDSEYMIHFPMLPEAIYGDPPPGNLRGILIVGDDFAGGCDAYNMQAGWIFGTIGDDARFEPANGTQDFTAFLYDWYGKPEQAEQGDAGKPNPAAS